MNIKLVERDGDRVKFEISGTNPAFVNALRRTMNSEVPTLAIEDVTFIKNSSGLFDESLAHRLGLIPWKFNSKDINDKGIEMSLNAKGPCKVIAKDIKTPKGIEAVNPNLLIVTLFEGQEIKLEGVAKLGYGKDHAKWQAAISSYQYYPEIEIGKINKPEEIAKVCPNKVFEVKNGKLIVKDLEACSLCYRCVDLSNGAIKLNERSDKFIFNLESISGLKPKEIVSKATEILENQVEEFKNSLKNLKF